MILVTGGAGFIGTNFVLNWLKTESSGVINLDKLTYAGNLGNLVSVESDSRYTFVQGDILDRALVYHLLAKHEPVAIVHFAAETHVDRSIYHPGQFAQTNMMGTLALLDVSMKYWKTLPAQTKETFRFIHISTDEVYGSLADDAQPIREGAPYAPNSPYAASKAAADHFVRAYGQTYQLPVITTHATNNFGPYQFPEKLIPLMIVQALEEKPLPLYGDGLHRRNWIYVEDHCNALKAVLAHGVPGEVYNIGDNVEMSNRQVVEEICHILDELKPRPGGLSYASLIQYVKDRPAHDRRYALDSNKIRSQLGWEPAQSFKANLRATILWYLENLSWVQKILSGEYRNWMATHYSERISQ